MNGRDVQSSAFVPKVTKHNSQYATVEFRDLPVKILLSYSLEEDRLRWGIDLTNESDESIEVQGLHVWFSLAYIMFRTQDVYRNMHESCAVFTHLGGSFAKFAAVRRQRRTSFGNLHTQRNDVSHGFSLPILQSLSRTGFAIFGRVVVPQALFGGGWHFIEGIGSCRLDIWRRLQSFGVNAWTNGKLGVRVCVIPKRGGFLSSRRNPWTSAMELYTRSA